MRNGEQYGRLILAQSLNSKKEACEEGLHVYRSMGESGHSRGSRHVGGHTIEKQGEPYRGREMGTPDAGVTTGRCGGGEGGWPGCRERVSEGERGVPSEGGRG